MSEHSSQALIGRLAVCLLLMAPFLSAGQVAPAPASGEPGVRVPGFWDPRRRPEKPDLSRISVIRFLTETDYPLFNFAGPDGNPQGDSFWGRRAADPWWATPLIRTNLSSRKPQAAVCRQSISDSWLGNLRECLAHLV